jgi:hypothetical protein
VYSWHWFAAAALVSHDYIDDFHSPSLDNFHSPNLDDSNHQHSSFLHRGPTPCGIRLP